MAALPSSHPVANWIRRAFDRRCEERSARLHGIRLLRNDLWLRTFEAAVSALEGIWSQLVDDDLHLAKLLQELAEGPGKPPSKDNAAGYGVFCQSAFAHTGREVHMQEIPCCCGPFGDGKCHPGELPDLLACDLADALSHAPVHLPKAKACLAWQGERASKRLARCLEEPGRILGEADGFRQPVHLAPSGDGVEGAEAGPLFGPPEPEEDGGTAILFVVVSRMAFPGSQSRSYHRHFRPGAPPDGDPRLRHRGVALVPGYDMHVLRAKGGFYGIRQYHLPSKYELVVMDVAQLLPIAAVDFRNEPPEKRTLRPQACEHEAKGRQPRRWHRPASADASPRRRDDPGSPRHGL